LFSVINTLTRVKSSTEANDVSQHLPRKKLKAKRKTGCKCITRNEWCGTIAQSRGLRRTGVYRDNGAQLREQFRAYPR
jgi:hypothetical protein